MRYAGPGWARAATIVALVMGLTGTPDAAHAQDAKYFAMAHAIPVTKKPCGTSELLVAKEMAIPAGNYGEHLRAFRAEFEQRYKLAAYKERTATLVRPNQVMILYSFEREWPTYKCSSRLYQYIVARTFDEAERILESRRTGCGKACTPFAVIRRWPESRSK